MKPNEFLDAMLEAQTLEENGPELKELRSHRDDIEQALRKTFGSSPIIRYGGSYAKGDLIKDSYDLDMVCYFPRDDQDAGSTLKDIYENVEKALSERWYLERKTSALRVRSKDKVDFHVDVVPGRFVSEKSYDAFLYCSSREKGRLLTNIETHIAHVRESGVIDVIKLVKLWRNRNGVNLKTFALELLVIQILKGSRKNLDDQIQAVLLDLSDESNEIKIQDPANPLGNDLSDIWNPLIRIETATIARATLSSIKSFGWEGVLGKLPNPEVPSKIDALRGAARATSSPSKPWCHE